MKNKMIVMMKQFLKDAWTGFKLFLFMIILPGLVIFSLLIGLFFYSLEGMNTAFVADKNTISKYLQVEDLPEGIENVKCVESGITDYNLDCLFDITDKSSEVEFINIMKDNNFDSYACSGVPSKNTTNSDLFSDKYFIYDVCYSSGFDTTQITFHLNEDRTMGWYSLYVE